MTRRKFNIAFGIGLLALTPLLPASVALVEYGVVLDTVHKGYDGVYCWVHPRAGIVPRGENRSPVVVLLMQPLWMKGSDVFEAMREMVTSNLGRTWIGPYEHTETLGRRAVPNGAIIAPCSFWPKWHAKSGKLLGTGETVHYVNNAVEARIPRQTCYSVYNAESRTWAPWKTITLAPGVRLHSEGAGSTQRVDLPNGDILLPTYYLEPGEGEAEARSQADYRSAVLRCRFDGETLTAFEIGAALAKRGGRGYYEPSLTRFKGRFYLTMRNDDAGYVATSSDGLNFDEPRKWTWDDGTDLGNYNTQQHWVTHDDGLFLVYTRRGASNDHVMRNRAPLFMGQVDPDRLVVLRATERILVPERGARLGNFGVTEVSPDETWVTVAEWMQKVSPTRDWAIPVDNPRGADNSVYVARIFWKEPNLGFGP